GEIHHCAKTEVDDVNLAGGDIGRECFLQSLWKYRCLVPAKIVATQHACFDVTALAVLVAMQVHQHLVHEDRALVIEGLPQVRHAQRVARVAVAPDRVGGHQCSSSICNGGPL